MLNGLEDCVVVPVALTTRREIVRLDFYGGNSVDSSASIVTDFRPDQKVSRSIFVPTFPFVEIASAVGAGPIGIVKIDVEGAERDVVASLLGTAERDRPWMIVEILPAYVATNERRISRQLDIERMLNELGYFIFRIRKDGAQRFSELQRLNAFDLHGDITLSDYLFCPSEDAELIARLVPTRA
jgi:FkbM family methyltransferase